MDELFKKSISESSNLLQSLHKESLSSENFGDLQLIKQYSIPKISAVVCAVVLEEAIDKLGIIGQIGGLPDVKANLNYKTLENRFDKHRQEIQIFDLDSIETCNMALNKEKFVKLQKDRSYLEKILEETKASLVKTNNYWSLVKYLHLYNLILSEENDLLVKQQETKLKFNKLEKSTEIERLKALSHIQMLSEKIGNLKDDIENVSVENNIKCNYLKKWEDSRMEQNSLNLNQKEAIYRNMIHLAKSNIEKETRIHAEIEAYILETQKDYLDGIQYWMQRYDKDLEMKDTEIQILKDKREKQFNDLQQLSNLYHQHKLEIEEYLVVREARRIEDERIAKRIIATIRIQAWWRGTMVRQHLGPYRIKKEKKSTRKKK